MKRIREIRANKPIVAADFWCDGPLVARLPVSRAALFPHQCAGASSLACSISSRAQHQGRVAEDRPFERLLQVHTATKPRSEKHLSALPIIDRPQILRDALEKFHPRRRKKGRKRSGPSRRRPGRIRGELEEGDGPGLATRIPQRFMTPWNDSIHRGRARRSLLERESSAEPPREPERLPRGDLIANRRLSRPAATGRPAGHRRIGPWETSGS